MSPEAAPAASAHQVEVETWRARRLASLRRPDSWLSLIGLFWLEPGANAIGSDPSSRVVLPPEKAPARLGVIDLSGSVPRFRAEPGASVTNDGKPVAAVEMKSDSGGEPTVLRHGSLTFYIIERGERLGVRVKDSEARALRDFRGLESFPFDERFRFVARYERYDPPKLVSVPNVLGDLNPEKSPGALIFDYEGRSYRLDCVIEAGTKDLFVIFGDSTNGQETYGGGRFLYAAPPVHGRTVLDFNRAYNPPCVFSPYATCPLPPPQNRLPIRVEAGEKNYGH
jgi:uncharacterized protein